jgi:hypothetical protein
MLYGHWMVEKKPETSTKSAGRPLGTTGETVRTNIRRIRENRRIAVTELSAKMAELDRPIPPLGIHRIEDGQRRVDVDDLLTFAVALGVSPSSLLMPYVDSDRDEISFTGHPDPLPAGMAWMWLGLALPLSPSPGELADFIAHAWPIWRARSFADAMEAGARKYQENLGHFDSDPVDLAAAILQEVSDGDN